MGALLVFIFSMKEGSPHRPILEDEMQSFSLFLTLEINQGSPSSLDLGAQARKRATMVEDVSANWRN